MKITHARLSWSYSRPSLLNVVLPSETVYNINVCMKQALVFVPHAAPGTATPLRNFSAFLPLLHLPSSPPIIII